MHPSIEGCPSSGLQSAMCGCRKENWGAGACAESRAHGALLLLVCSQFAEQAMLGVMYDGLLAWGGKHGQGVASMKGEGLQTAAQRRAVRASHAGGVRGVRDYWLLTHKSKHRRRGACNVQGGVGCRQAPRPASTAAVACQLLG